MSRRLNRAAAKSKISHVWYSASEMIAETERLDQPEELAYRRIFDRVLLTGDALPDDDQLLARLTKAPAPAWAKIKARLLELGMIIVKAGRITISHPQPGHG
jgi:hypothetical protein